MMDHYTCKYNDMQRWFKIDPDVMQLHWLVCNDSFLIVLNCSSTIITTQLYLRRPVLDRLGRSLECRLWRYDINLWSFTYWGIFRVFWRVDWMCWQCCYGSSVITVQFGNVIFFKIKRNASKCGDTGPRGRRAGRWALSKSTVMWTTNTIKYVCYSLLVKTADYDTCIIHMLACKILFWSWFASGQFKKTIYQF